jgi:hypothetical protein
VRKTAQLILINLAIFCCLLLVMELSVRLVVDSYSDHKTFRLTRPAPYLGAPYFSEEFINESFVQPGGWSTPPGTSLLFPNDFKGRFFTVENGIRRTTDTPGQASKNLFLFGGSTVYNSEVPDSYTIASYLQRKLASTGINDYRVLNYGVTSVSTNQQLERSQRCRPGSSVWECRGYHPWQRQGQTSMAENAFPARQAFRAGAPVAVPHERELQNHKPEWPRDGNGLPVSQEY